VTTTQESTAAPRETDGVRPPWVTEAHLQEWRGWVSRAASAGGEAAGETASLAPYDLSPIPAVPTSTPADVAAAVELGRAAQRDWATTPVSRRAEIVLRFHDLLLEHQDEVVDLIQWETGKARFFAWQEIAQVATIARHYARRAGHYLADQDVRGMVPGLTKVRKVRAPRGVVGIISPWNYPLYLGSGDALPALLAGNAVVSKADDQTALTLLWTRALMDRAGLPPGLWQVVVGDGPVVGSAVVDAVDYVCFTGSTTTGREVAGRAAHRLIGTSLELGGKNPLIVRGDADVLAAVKGAVTSAFANTGQMCIHTERIYVHDSVYDAFRDAFVAAASGLRIGLTYDYTADVGCLVSPKQLAAVSAHVDDAVQRGATVLTGGRARPDLGPLCYEPTVLEGVTPEMAVCREETFGPVVSLYRFGTDEEAVALANEGSYGLSASIWSADTRAARALAREIRAGSVNINDGAAAAAGSIEAEMGGMGQSGLGRRHGAEGIRKFTDNQTIATQTVMPLGPPGKMTVEGFVGFTNRQLGLFRRLRVR